MDNVLLAELRSMTAAALVATTAGERGDWRETARCVADLESRAQRILRQLTLTTQELNGNGECRSDEPPNGA